MVSIWSASGTYPHDDPIDNRSVVEAARRAAANYTLAVPQFYGGRIQLLLPLCLTGDKPELALTIQREDGFYAARTCLTLDMAYNNARLICRPETSWIKR